MPSSKARSSVPSPRRQALEQYFTASQSSAHLRLHENGRPHDTQSLSGGFALMGQAYPPSAVAFLLQERDPLLLHSSSTTTRFSSTGPQILSPRVRANAVLGRKAGRRRKTMNPRGLR